MLYFLIDSKQLFFTDITAYARSLRHFLPAYEISSNGNFIYFEKGAQKHKVTRAKMPVDIIAQIKSEW